MEKIIPLIIFGSIFIIHVILTVIDYNCSEKINKDGDQVLRLGYNAYTFVIILPLFIFIMIISALEAMTEESGVEIIFIGFSIALVVVFIHSILAIRNHRVFYNNDMIRKTNFLKRKSQINFKDLKSVKYSIFGLGRDLVFNDKNGDKIMVSSHLNGFKFLAKKLKEKNLIKK